MNKTLKNIKVFINKYENFFLILFLAIISIASICYFYSHNEILLYKDARSHLDIARRVIDSLTPGITQIGSIWLPLYQLLEIPFIWNNFLWHSGLAGSIISGLSYIGASFFIYKIIYKLTKTKVTAFIGMLFFSLNPNILYLQSVPLDEITTLFFINASLYYLLTWSESKKIHYLILSALAIFFGSLVRYETWFLTIFEIIYIYFFIRKSKELKKLESNVLLFSTLAFFGIFLWVTYNYLIWHNPLYFLNSEFSAKTQQLYFINKGLLNTKDNILLSIEIFFSDFAENAGYVATIMTFFATIFLLFRKDKLYKKFFYFVTFSPILFILLSLYMGITILYTKMFPIPETSQVFNVRYGILAVIPTSIILAKTFSILAKKIKLKFIAYIFLLLILIADMGIFYFTKPITVIADGTNGLSAFGQSNETSIAKQITANCSSGLTLISAGQNDKLMFASGLDMNKFIYEGSGSYWATALNNPKNLATCIVITTNDVVYQNFSTKQKLLNSYKVIYNSADTKVYKIKTT